MKGNKMCGICGINGELEDNGIVLAMLLLENEKRGVDATGIAYNNRESKNVRFVKAGMTASRFIYKYIDDKKENINTNNIIGHTRQGTGGDANDNRNNHPFIGDKYVLIHNGVLINDKSLTFKHKLERFSETDSEVLLRIMEKFGIEKGLSKVNGTFAIAMIDIRKPSRLILIRNNASYAPIYVGKTDGGCVVFSSIENSLLDFCSKKSIYAVPDNSLRIFEDGKLITKEKLVLPDSYTYHSYLVYGGSYGSYNGWRDNAFFRDDYYDDLEPIYTKEGVKYYNNKTMKYEFRDMATLKREATTKGDDDYYDSYIKRMKMRKILEEDKKEIEFQEKLEDAPLCVYDKNTNSFKEVEMQKVVPTSGVCAPNQLIIDNFYKDSTVNADKSVFKPNKAVVRKETNWKDSLKEVGKKLFPKSEKADLSKKKEFERKALEKSLIRKFDQQVKIGGNMVEYGD